MSINGIKALLIHGQSEHSRPALRYRETPTFGKSIRRFSKTVSEMKKMTGRDVEDVLLVSIFPEDSSSDSDGWCPSVQFPPLPGYFPTAPTIL
jgi:hypothetical protein